METTLEHIPGGAFFVARKTFSSAIWAKDPMYWKIWTWIIGQASFEPRVMKGQECGRGEFITTYHDIIHALSHYHNREHIFPTPKQVRIILEWFEKESMIRVSPIRKISFRTGADPTSETRAYLGIKITVLNYDTYQNGEIYKGRHQGRPSDEQGQTINNKGNKVIKNPFEISAEISALVEKTFPSPEGKKLFEEMKAGISSTRKTGKVSPSILLSVLTQLTKHSPEDIAYAVGVFLRRMREGRVEGRECENYLLGILRNHRGRDNKDTQPMATCAGSGSSLLDQITAKYRAGEIVPKETGK